MWLHQATDYAGNTALYDAMENTGPLASTTVFLLETALEVRIDPEIGNHQGRTILHAAAALPFLERCGYSGSDFEARLDFVLQKILSLDVNAADNEGLTALHLASTKSAFRVSELLTANASIELADHSGRRPIHYAPRARQSNGFGLLASHLKEKFMSLDAADENRRTPLHDAARSGVPESVKFLLDSSANPNKKDKSGKTPLHAASEFVEEEKLWALQRSAYQYYSTQCNDCRYDNREKTPNSYLSHPVGHEFSDLTRPFEQRECCSPNSVGQRSIFEDTNRINEVVLLLLDYGANVSGVDNEGNTILDFAIHYGCRPIIGELSSRKQSSNIASARISEPNYGVGPPGMSFEGQWLSLETRSLETKLGVDFIQGISTSPEETTSFLVSAIRTGNEATIDELLRLGADSLMVQPNGKIILHATVQCGLTSVTERLVQSMGENRSLPEATAREQPNIEMVKLLVALGVDINALDIVGPRIAYGDSIKTAMHLVAVGKHWWHHVALDWWLENGGNPEQTTADGKTVLQIAIRGRLKNYAKPGYWREEAVAVLLKCGAEMNLVDSKGRTAHIDTFTEGIEMVKTLLQNGADVSLCKMPPIYQAAISGDDEIVQALILAGADCNVTILIPYPRIDLPKSEPLILKMACQHFNSEEERQRPSVNHNLTAPSFESNCRHQKYLWN